MRKMLVIAVREYLAAVKTKSFILSLVIMPMLMGGSIVVQTLLSGFHDTRTKKYAIIDRSGDPHIKQAIKQAIDGAIAQHNKEVRDSQTGQLRSSPFEVTWEPVPEGGAEALKELELRLSEQVRKGQLLGILEIGPKVAKPLPAPAAAGSGEQGAGHETGSEVRYQTDRPTDQGFPQTVLPAINQAIAEIRFQEAGLRGKSLAEVRGITQPVKLQQLGLSRRTPQGTIEPAKGPGQYGSIAVPLILMLLMFMVIMMAATPQMQGVVEEKMQRIAEVLLGSVQPFVLMLGKLLGMTAVSLTITVVYLGGGYWAALHFGFGEYVSGGLVAWFLVFQSLSVLMFGSLFIAIGAACTDMKETQNLLWPVMILATFPLFFMGNVLQEPSSTVATALSFFPFATPTLMMARIAIPPGIPWWQPALGVLLVLLTTLLCIYVAGRIFRVGILMQGKGARLDELFRWVIRG